MFTRSQALTGKTDDRNIEIAANPRSIDSNRGSVCDVLFSAWRAGPDYFTYQRNPGVPGGTGCVRANRLRLARTVGAPSCPDTEHTLAPARPERIYEPAQVGRAITHRPAEALHS